MDIQKIYNQILVYYDILENIKNEILQLKKFDDSIKIDQLMPKLEELQRAIDFLMKKYIFFTKNLNDKNLYQDLINILDNILEKISNYKNIIYDLYKDINN